MTTPSTSRGILILDEGLEPLKAELRKRDIRILLPSQGTFNESLLEIYASGRILVTQTPKKYLHQAIEFEFGVLSTEHFKQVDAKLASTISKAMMDNKLFQKAPPFLATLQPDGLMTVQDLEG